MTVDKGQDWKLKMLAKALTVKHVKGLVGNPFKSFNSLKDELFSSWTVSNPVKSGLRMAHIMIHADTFNELTSEISYGYKRGKVTRESLMLDFEAFKEVMKEGQEDDALLDKILKDGNREDILAQDALDALLRQAKRLLSMGIGIYEDIQKFVEQRYPGQSTYDSPSTSMLMRYWNGMQASEGSAYNTHQFILATRDVMPAKEAVDGYLVLYLFDELRKQIHPMGHEGSQAGFSDMHTKFGKSYLQRIEDYRKREE
jgi:hypothetical protein